MLTHHVELDFLDHEACAGLVAEIDRRPAVAAGVHREGNKYVDDSFRRAEAGLLPEPVRSPLEARWLDVGRQLAPRFGCRVTAVTDTHTVHYRPGDFFAPHADYSGGVLPDGTPARVLSLVVFLNDDFGGGVFKLRGDPDWIAIPASTGALVVFPSGLLHEVSPVTRGERYTLVSWLY